MNEHDRVEIIEEIAKKIRTLNCEYSKGWDKDLIIVSPYQLGNEVIGYKHIYVSTLGYITLANCDGKLAREFENS